MFRPHGRAASWPFHQEAAAPCPLDLCRLLLAATEPRECVTSVSPGGDPIRPFAWRPWVVPWPPVPPVVCSGGHLSFLAGPRAARESSRGERERGVSGVRGDRERRGTLQAPRRPAKVDTKRQLLHTRLRAEALVKYSLCACENFTDAGRKTKQEGTINPSGVLEV